MRRSVQALLSLLLSLSLAGSLALPALASYALGEDLTREETLLNHGTQLSTGVFWSTTYSDLRTEHVVTYEPNTRVTPIVYCGDALTSRSTVSSAAKELENGGWRVVAGLNGDFYNTGNGLPVGLVVSEGVILSSDAGSYAVGFRRDGTAVMGKPALKISADLGYTLTDESGYEQEVLRPVAAINKARVSTGGIYLYSYDFNSTHTTGNTEPGVDVICDVEEGALSIGSTLRLRVAQVAETEKSSLAPNQVVLSVNLKSDPYYVEALRRLTPGGILTLTVTASSPEWSEVDYAVGALYALVENGAEVANLSTSGASPRTAVGRRADGTLVFYTIDGRKSGHSIGATMMQTAERMLELGCVTAFCLDGGGSTTLSVTQPDAAFAGRVNTPSEGSERAVSNQIFLVSDERPTGELSHFLVKPEHDWVLAGSRVKIEASAIDTAFYPTDGDYYLESSAGEIENGVLRTPTEGGTVTVTARNEEARGSAAVHAVVPEGLHIRSGSSSSNLTSLTVAPGASANLRAYAVYNHLAVYVDPEALTWSLEGNVGQLSDSGVFIAGDPGEGVITLTAAGKSVSIPVSVTRLALKSVEDFEQNAGAFESGEQLAVSQVYGAETARMGLGALRLDYSGLEEGSAFAPASCALPAPYSQMSLWIRGDGSGNRLYLYLNGEEHHLTDLDFTEWRLFSVPVTPGSTVTGVEIRGVRAEQDIPQEWLEWAEWQEWEEWQEWIRESSALQTPAFGTVYLDQITAAFEGAVDLEPPEISAQLHEEERTVTASVRDEMDGVLPRASLTVTLNGAPVDFNYAQGRVTVALPEAGESSDASRVAITARDASGNLNRVGVDLPPVNAEHRFTDLEGCWAADYIDYLFNAGVLSEDTGLAYRPNDAITRLEFAVMLAAALNLPDSEETELPYADLDKIPASALPAVRTLYAWNIMRGTVSQEDGKTYLYPDRGLTRAQASAMIGRGQPGGYPLSDLSFSDSGDIPAYAADHIRAMVGRGILSGFEDGSFRPGRNITRAQMAKILYNLL